MNKSKNGFFIIRQKRIHQFVFINNITFTAFFFDKCLQKYIYVIKIDTVLNLDIISLQWNNERD